MKTSNLALIVTVASAVASARTLGAQQGAAAAPTHAGQWGIEAYAAETGGGGLLLFVAPATALVLDGSLARTRSSSNDDGSGQPGGSYFRRIDLSFGLRHHAMVAPHVAATFGAGVATLRETQRFESSGNVGTLHSTFLGGYGEFGGQYILNDHLAIGAAYRLDLRNVSSKRTDSSGFSSNETGSAFGMTFLPIRATLYF